MSSKDNKQEARDRFVAPILAHIARRKALLKAKASAILRKKDIEDKENKQ